MLHGWDIIGHLTDFPGINSNNDRAEQLHRDRYMGLASEYSISSKRLLVRRKCTNH